MNPYEDVETPLAHKDILEEGKMLRAKQDAMQKRVRTFIFSSSSFGSWHRQLIMFFLLLLRRSPNGTTRTLSSGI